MFHLKKNTNLKGHVGIIPSRLRSLSKRHSHDDPEWIHGHSPSDWVYADIPVLYYVIYI